jgi:hypothetical protein
MKRIAYVFALLALLLALIACSVVSYCYRDMQCAAAHGGASAPASIAFFWLIPFGGAIAICAVVAYVCYKKSRKGEN